MRVGRLRKNGHKWIAWLLITACVLPQVWGSGMGTLTVRAKENGLSLGSNGMDGEGIVSLGQYHSAVIKTDGSLWMWGSNSSGQLGNIEGREPREVIKDVKVISLGYHHSAAIKTDGSLWMWGSNSSGQLGNEAHIFSKVPTEVMKDVKAVSLGNIHSAAIKTDGSLWMWGSNSSGELGNGKYGTGEVSDKPIEVMKDVKAVSLGYSHSAAIKTDGSLWMWGLGLSGELGNGTWESDDKPIEVMKDVRAVSLGDCHSAAIKTDGSLWMWGSNRSGQLGDGRHGGASYNSCEPIEVMKDVRAVSLGSGHSAAIKTDGSLWMWGSNDYGELGNGKYGTGEVSDKPIEVMKDVKAVSLGYNHSVAIKTDGSLWMWGYNEYGCIGSNVDVRVTVPVQIMPPGSISLPDVTDPAPAPDDEGKFDMEVEEGEGQQIEVEEVVNGKLAAVVGATVTYDGKEYTTSEKGRVTLTDFKRGKKLTIAKEGYIDVEEEKFNGDRHGKVVYFKLWKSNDSDAILQSVWLARKDQENVDLLTEEVQLNLADTKKFNIFCTSEKKTYDRLELYVGEKKIADADDNIFFELSAAQFSSGEPVVLYIYRGSACIKKRLKLHTTYISPPITALPIADHAPGIQIKDDVPIVGGREIKIEIEDVPIEFEMNTDGTCKAIINFGEIVTDGKDFDEIYSRMKLLNSGNFSEFMGEKYVTTSKTSIKPDFEFAGYLESNASTMDHLEGKLWVKAGIGVACENQVSLGPVPVVVEISIEGSLQADGRLVWKAQEGLDAAIGVGGEVGLGAYCGIGFEKVLNGGVYGNAVFSLHYIILPEDNRGIDECYVDGDIGVRGEVTGLVYTVSLIKEKKDIIGGNQKSAYAGSQALALGDYAAYESVSRDYLNADGTMAQWMEDSETHIDGNTDEVNLQSTAYLCSIPQVVRMGDTTLLFYLTDAGAARDEADRSMLVYSLWEPSAGKWSEPVPVLAEDDGTADFEPDFYVDGNKVYAVWQNAKGSLKDLDLTERVKHLSLHAAVYDAEQKQFVDLGKIESENGLFQQKAQIAANDGGVFVYWHENAQDNVLGLSGTNRIYRASLTDNSILTGGIQVKSASEEEEVDPAQDEVEEETSDAGETGADEPEEETPDEGETGADEPEEETPDEGESEADEPEEETPDEGETGADEPEEETPDVGESKADEPEEEMPDAEESASDESENTASVFRKYVALTEETPTQEILTEEGSVSENTVSDEEEEVEPESPEESVSENTVPEEIVSENTISENTIQTKTYGAAEQAEQPWTVTLLEEEKDCIYSADAGRINGKTGYAYAAGAMDQTYDVDNGRVVFLEDGKAARILGNGKVGSVNFYPIYAEETLSWYEAGDIGYVDRDGETDVLFGESRLPSSSYTLLSDGTSPEVIYPVNTGGKANLYRISCENGVFLPALQVTDQEDYIQHADGFISNGQTILVYNRMEVNDKLEEVNNSLCTGVIAHSYYDIALQSAGSMIVADKENGADTLEIAAWLYNNGTVKAENLSLVLCKADGTVLQTVSTDTVLEPGESGRAVAVFSPDLITEEAEYMIKVSGAAETNEANNSTMILLGAASLQIDAEVTSLSGTRSLQVGILNTGVTECGGTVSVRDSETGKEYCSSKFDPVSVGTRALAEITIDPDIFVNRKVLPLEVVVVPDSDKVQSVSDFVTVFAPSYSVDFVTDTGTATIYVNHGSTAEFPKNPVQEGAHFIGWYSTQNPAAGTLYTENTPITEDVILYACFAEEQTAIPMENCSVSSIPMQYYTGGQIKPKVTVKWGSEVLKANKDYKITYQNNKDQGTATVTIAAVAGKGKKFTGSITRTFSIMYPTNKVSVKVIPAVNFTGAAHTPEPVVTYQTKTLVKDKDYTVSYYNNRNAGTAGVTITGKGTFSGEKTVTFKINGTAISGMKFDKIPDVVYNGKNTRPIVTVRTKDGKTQLMSGADYRLVYENTVNKGTATVTVIGNGNYTGTKKLSYKVTAKPLAESMIAVEQLSPASSVVAPEKAVYTYTGTAIKPFLTVTDEAAGGKVLVLNKDYTISYSKNKAVGEAQITVKGKGNYTGTVKVPFVISPVDLAQAETASKIEVRVSDMTYTGKALKPAVQIYETVDGKEKKIPAGGYTLSYTNNTEKGTGTVTITGKEKSGYSGTVTAQFRIVDKAKLITASTIKIDAIPAQTFTGTVLEPAVHIVDKSDKTKETTLEKGTHYEITYRNNVNVGKATVTIKGIGSYAGSKNVTFKINKRAIANKNILEHGFTVEQIPDLKYTGYAQKPDVFIRNNGSGKKLVQGKDYKLSYRNNTNIGTATVTVSGIGNYGGSINNLSFRIVSWDYSTLTAEVADQVYTGKALKPQIIFYMTGESGREEIPLKVNTAVKIAYIDNKDVGTATVTVSGKGVLKDIAPVTANFEIEHADITEAVVSRIANQTLKGTAVKPVPKVKLGRNSLKEGRDFEVRYLRNGVKGEATAIIRGVGNYTGECRKTFIVQ